jgi:Regulator of chromosome condensation (RCC1) repeat
MLNSSASFCSCSFSASEVLSGPEHSACLSTDGDVHLWGSNEFQQAGVAGPTAVFKPVPLGSLGTRKVLSIACGGSHTLAVVADALDSDGGAVVGWGTGTVGQLGLGQSHLLSNEPLVIPMPEIHGHPVPVRKVAAGLVTSAAILSTGELFVWGDASLGRLGLPDIPDTLTPTGQPVLVNGKVIWTPQQLDFRAVPGLDLGKNFVDKRIVVVNVGLGGSFSLYLLHAGEGTGAGGVLLLSGALGVDITKDRYGYPEEVSGATAALDLKLEEEIKSVPRNLVPKVVAPFGNKPIVLAISAGARHAGVVAQEPSKGNAPRAYTGGKGWLAHAGDSDSMLLPKPAITSHFAPVVGILGDEDGES